MADPAAGSALSPCLPQCRRQNQITDYFTILGSSRRGVRYRLVPGRVPRITILTLPQHVREKIYDEANIGGDKFIDLNFWTIKEGIWKDYDGQPLNKVPASVLESRSRESNDLRSDFYEKAFPAVLLGVGSRLIHHEVQARLYAHNTFAVSLLGPDGLRPLDRLSDAALQELRVLVVSLRPCKCLTPFCSKIDWGLGECGVWPRPRSEYFWDALERLSKGIHSRPLGCVSRIDKKTLAQWQRICTRLASNTRPHQLKLYILAAPADCQTANAILDPLRMLPALADVAIGLGLYLKNTKARSPARDLALSLTGKLQYPPFRFLDLPLELQLQILEHTSLVDKTFLIWDPSCRLQSQSSRWSCYTPSQVTSCINWEAFCSLKHTDGFSPRCECRESPLPYYLVSRAFAATVRSIFYGRNEFRLFPSRWCRSEKIAGLDVPECYELTLLSFLDHVPLDSISCLTHVTLVLPPLAPAYLPPDQRGWAAWVAAIQMLRHRADLGRLMLEVHFSDQDPLPDRLAESDTLLRRFTLARRSRDADLEKTMLDTYMRILAPLKELGAEGLRALLVYVAWPLCGSAREDRKADERRLERMIMGEGYDSARWGKRDKSPYSQPERSY